MNVEHTLNKSVLISKIALSFSNPEGKPGRSRPRDNLSAFGWVLDYRNNNALHGQQEDQFVLIEQNTRKISVQPQGNTLAYSDSRDSC